MLAHTTLPVGVSYTTLELKVNYIRAAHTSGRTLTATGTVGRRQREEQTGAGTERVEPGIQRSGRAGIYVDHIGWRESTFGVTDLSALPLNAQRYLARIEALVGVRLDLISTGPDREQTIIKRHPLDP